MKVLKLALLMLMMCGSVVMAQTDVGGRNWTERERQQAGSLSHRFDLSPPADCAQRCERPVSVNEKIYCCVTCLGALYICGVAGGCYCEVPLD